MTLLKVPDAVGQPAPTHVVVEELDRTLLLEDGFDTSADCLNALVRELRLNDEGGLVFSHQASSRTGL